METGLPPKVCPLWDVMVEGRRLALSGGTRQTWLSEGMPKATTALVKTCPAPQALGAPGLMEERSGSGPPRGGQGVFRVLPSQLQSITDVYLYDNVPTDSKKASGGRARAAISYKGIL